MKTLGILLGYAGIVVLLAWLAPVWATVAFAFLAAPAFIIKRPPMHVPYNRRHDPGHGGSR